MRPRQRTKAVSASLSLGAPEDSGSRTFALRVFLLTGVRVYYIPSMNQTVYQLYAALLGAHWALAPRALKPTLIVANLSRRWTMRSI